MLENLRETRRYDQIPVFIERLAAISHPSQMVMMHIGALAGLYRLLLLLDRESFTKRKNSSTEARCFSLPR